ncbi:MAG: Xaa-Pro peptidase family protein [Candidatus Kapabacteria bacterium]|jgi:Xaa-Pro aminopeptidase|nr:Xaa-Pro peptidase family protein [Candidatus Kapabacteria bacterium]
MKIIHEQRIEELRSEFDERGIDALFVTHVPHVAYLTGFSGSSAMLVLTRTAAHFITDGRYAEQARQEITASGMTIHIEREWWAYIQEKQLPEGATTIGFEASHISVAGAETMQRTVEGRSWKAITGMVEAVVMVKTREEVDCIKSAAAIATKVYDHVLRVAKVGMTENDIAAEVAYVAKKLGSEGEGFETIVASGVRGALPHGRASNKAIRQGELVTLDFGCRVGGFYSDVTRTFALGEPAMFDRAIFALVLLANETGIAAAQGGINVATLDAAAREIIKDAGYGDDFAHGLGHGLGREVHEKPSVSYRFPDDIAPVGAVITIEPGIYLAERCGVRIEDDVWLTETGCEVLTGAIPKHLIVVE